MLHHSDDAKVKFELSIDRDDFFKLNIDCQRVSIMNELQARLLYKKNFN